MACISVLWFCLLSPFYIILSLTHQDVMHFLKQIESDAVNKLFSMIPILYVATLFILFFLVYFSSSMQMERRKHEFGVYLTLGMQRSKLFLLLLLEDFEKQCPCPWNRPSYFHLNFRID